MKIAAAAAAVEAIAVVGSARIATGVVLIDATLAIDLPDPR